MGAGAVPEGGVYLLGRTSAEYERLREQAASLEPITSALFDQTGLRPGMRCLDIGCGPGEVMRLMAERVGPEGSVVGIDVDGRLGREAESMLRRGGYRQCSFVEGDFLKLHFTPAEQFDLCFRGWWWNTWMTRWPGCAKCVNS